MTTGQPVNPEQPVSTPASSGVPSTGPSMAVAVGNTINPRKIPWTEVKPVADGLEIFWWSGVEPCNSLDRVDVTYSATEVTVTLWEGTTDKDAICIEIAIEKKTIVKLSEPVGDRKIVDGAK
ncbi:hypothetical protein GCM10009555_014040 [Acrocarpospora macrocephala]|uniref:Uncharacterized protein n=1 Tax=Acrocarpospora macrocephala TaxID=150177 RepID=A0A5M3WJK3_9ACTN|nr:hypothetical protein [Acrocarpospora macrocephala]GES08212.1 hypothetical protein Amac_018070 [Acrocarpospora macrocephala]